MGSQRPHSYVIHKDGPRLNHVDTTEIPLITARHGRNPATHSVLGNPTSPDAHTPLSNQMFQLPTLYRDSKRLSGTKPCCDTPEITTLTPTVTPLGPLCPYQPMTQDISLPTWHGVAKGLYCQPSTEKHTELPLETHHKSHCSVTVQSSHRPVFGETLDFNFHHHV